MSGGFTIVDFTVPTRDSPVIHPCAEAPICKECRSADLCFFDPTCSSCQDVLSNPKTTISELFAIMRQWIPQTQGHLTLLTREVLRRGAHVNDKDGLTDLSLLHFASKAGAVGIGNGTTAANLVGTLINKGANTDLKCHWTDMNALHYAVFFDCEEVVELLCKHNPVLLTSTSSQFDGGNSLHIAASSLSLASARILLNYKADAGFADINSLLPHEVIPEVSSKADILIANDLRDILREASLNRPPIRIVRRSESPSAHSLSSRGSRGSPAASSNKPTPTATPTSRTTELKGVRKGHKADSTTTTSSSSTTKHSVTFSRQDSKPSSSTSSSHQPPQDSADSVVVGGEGPSPGLSSLPSSTQASGSPDETVTLESLGVKIGDKVVIDAGSSKQKKGTLRFSGDTMFSPGLWAGIELNDDSGRNDGSHGGIRYFSCKPKKGLFVLLKRISKDSSTPRSLPVTPVTTGGGGRKTATTPLFDSRAKTDPFVTAISSELQVGDHVLVSGRDKGVLRYAGPVKFAPGFWLGVELDSPKGTCDGSKGGKQYFKCKANHGVFVLPSKLSKIRSKDSIDYTGSGGGNVNVSSPSPNPPGERKKRISTAQVKSSKVQSTSSSSYTSPMPTGLSLAVAPDITLEKGMSVFVNKEMGTVQYIGQTDFAPGVWLGVELKKPSGKNDGSVNGTRYFSCKMNYGIFVKPERASHRGINCLKLVKTDK